MYVFDSLLIIGILLRGSYSVRLIGSKVIQPNFKVDKQTKKKTANTKRRTDTQDVFKNDKKLWLFGSNI